MATYQQELPKGNPDYIVYRCPDPVAVETHQPWYTMDNVCPCNPQDSNVTGRGFTPCPFGIQTDSYHTRAVLNLTQEDNKNNSRYVAEGNMYQDKQYTPPKLMPRPLSRIGQQWRSAN